MGVFAVILVLHPRIIATFMRLLLRMLKRESQHSVTPVSVRALLRSTLIMLLSWLLVGLSFVLLVNIFKDLTLLEQVVCVIAYPASFVVGFLAVTIPARLGVREAVLVGVLTVTLQLSPTPEASTALAVSIVLTHRFLVTLSDLLLLGIGFLWSGLH